MKKIYIVLSIMLVGIQISNAQLTLTKALHEPVIGDIERAADYDSTTAIPKTTGAGQVWNFNSMTVGSFTEVTTYTTVATAPSGSLFITSASIAAVRGGNSTDFFKSNATTFEYNGIYDMSGPETTTFANNAVAYNWPISLTSTNTDSFTATQNGGSGTVAWNGTLSYTATGAGTVILPGGNMHTNCLQVKQNLMLTMTQGTNTSTMAFTKYMYFSATSNKFPIAVIEYDTQTSGTVTTKDADIKINVDAMTVGMNEQQLANSNFIVYPNPASHNIRVYLPNSEIASSIEVIDVTGKVVATALNTNAIDISRLSKSAYTIRVKTKTSVLQKPIVITE